MGKGLSSAPSRKRTSLQQLIAQGYRFLTRSVRGTLVVLALTIVTPLILVQAAVNIARYQAQRANTLQNNLEIARAVATALNAYVEDILHQEQALGQAVISDPALSQAGLERLLAGATQEYPAIHSFAWVDAQGYIFADTESGYERADLSQQSYIRGIIAGRDWVVSDLLPDQTSGQPIFIIARGVRSRQGGLQGILLATVDPTRLGKALLVMRAGGGAIAIADRQGHGVYHFPEIEMSWEDRNWLHSMPLLAEALAGRETTGAFTSDGQERLAGLTPVEPMGWVAVASQPTGEAVAPATEGLLRDFGLFLLVASVAVLAAVQVGHRISRPIRHLQQIAAAIGRGEMSRRAQVQGLVEVEDLAATLNHMATEISLREERQAYLLSELQHSNEQLAAASALNEKLADEARARASELDAIFSSLAEAVIIYDAAGALQRANPAAARIYGLGPADVDRRQSLKRLHIRTSNGRPAQVEDLPSTRALRGETVLGERFRLVDGQGHDRTILISAAPLLRDNQITGAVATWHDITERERATDRTRRLQAVTAALSQAATPARVAEIIVEQSMAALDASAGSTSVLSKDGQWLEVLQSIGYAPEVQALRQRIALTANAPMAEAARTRRPVLLESPADLEMHYPQLATNQAPSGARAAFPVITEGHVLGAILLSFEEPRRFAEEDISFVQALARLGAQALYRAHLYEAESQARAQAEMAERRAALLAEASRLLSSSLDAEASLQSLAQYAVPRLGDWCVVEITEERNTPRLIAAVHADPAKEALLREIAARYPLSHERHPLHTALETGQARLYEEIRDDQLAEITPVEIRETIQKVGYGSALIVPLVAHGRTLGVFLLMSARPDLHYGLADLTLARDLAHRAALAVENALLYREAQEAIRFRDEFLSVAAHELKTPVTSLRGFAELTIRRLDTTGTVEPQRLRRALVEIDQQSDKLSRLVAQLLDISRIQGGRLQLEPELVDLAALIKGAVAVVQAGTTRHTITLLAPTPVPALLDPLRIEQVAVNLMVNAVKYSPAGGPIEVEVSAPSPDSVRLAVRDHGIGVPPADRERVFDRFVQAHAGYGGMGLGLYISRHIVELHGGTIELQAPPDGGSYFVVTLPSGLAQGDDSGAL